MNPIIKKTTHLCPVFMNIPVPETNGSDTLEECGIFTDGVSRKKLPLVGHRSHDPSFASIYKMEGAQGTISDIVASLSRECFHGGQESQAIWLCRNFHFRLKMDSDGTFFWLGAFILHVSVKMNSRPKAAVYDFTAPGNWDPKLERQFIVFHPRSY